eukprot:GHVN01101225.1.p2 GENE.GHVN01101225.1~~GHVN01101225.1.p2  ORF type:complete len:329 (-),score=23.10 GHVN01101225.1:39-1025(-)
MNTKNKAIDYAVCAAGIYIFFLAWGVLQERINSVEYRIYHAEASHTHSHFRLFIFLNLAQTCLSATIALSVSKLLAREIPLPSTALLFDYAKYTALNIVSFSSAQLALRRVSYPTMILGKSCKLLSSMLVGFLFFRRRYRMSELLVAAAITCGVSGFLFFEDSSKSSARQGSWEGLALLILSLFADGLSSAHQEGMFRRHKEVTSLRMMLFSNLWSFAFSLAYLLANPYSTELRDGISFLFLSPQLLTDLFCLCFCSSIGSLFVFRVVEEFGAASLLKITVTRKLFTIVLSLAFFGHSIGQKQWLCVFLVFAAIIAEFLLREKKKHRD